MERIKSWLIVLLIICMCRENLMAQTSSRAIDSLLVILKTASEDTVKLATLISLARQYSTIKKYDEGVKTATEAVAMANKILTGKDVSAALTYTAKKRIGDAFDITGAIIYNAQGKHEEVVKNILAAIRIREEIGDKPGLAITYGTLGLIYMNQGKHNEAVASHLAAIKIKEEIGNKGGMAFNYNGIGNSYKRRDNYPEAIKNYLVALKISTEAGDKVFEAGVYYNIGMAYQDQEKYKDALNNYLPALKLRQEIGDKRGIAQLQERIGMMYNHENNHIEAFNRFSEAARLHEELGNREGLGQTYASMGYSNAMMRKYEETLHYYQAALKIFEAIQPKDDDGTKLKERDILAHRNRFNIANVHHSIAQCYQLQGKYSEAIKESEIALSIMRELDYRNSVVGMLIDIASVYEKLHNFPKALKNYETAIIEAKETGSKSLISGSYSRLAQAYRRFKNYPEALKNYQLGMKVLRDTNYYVGISIFYSSVGEIYALQKNYQEALINYQASLKLRLEKGLERTGIAYQYQLIGNVYRDQGNYAEAMRHFLMAKKTLQTVYGEDGLSNFERKELSIYTYLIGTVQYLSGNFKEALESYLSYEKQQNEFGGNGERAIVTIRIGKMLAMQAALMSGSTSRTKFNEGVAIIEKGLSEAKASGDKEVLAEGYKAISETYKSMHDYKKALEASEQLAKINNELKDSALNSETNQKLEQLRTQYEVEKAVMAEKDQQEKLLAEQKFRSERELTEKNTKHKLEIAEENLKKEKAIEIEKLKYEFALTEERTEQEKLLAAQKFENEKKLAGENAQHQQDLAAERSTQEKKQADLIAQQQKQRAEQKRKTDLLMLGSGMMIIILIFAFLYFRQRTLKQKADDRAESVHKMAELELQSLRAQLNPHFMFNSLNAIQDLILKEDNRNSHRYLSRFSKLLRMLLDNATQPFVSLRKELDFLELYLSLENLRIPDLQHSIKIEPGIDTENTMIPNMMMQPYIENAIWHGLSHKTSDKKLDINIHRENGSIHCDIEDNGVGRQKAEELKSLYRKEHKSKGMELLSKRFNLLSKEYGTAIVTRITDLVKEGNAAGTLVEIVVPTAFTKKTKEILHDTHYYN
jgi:tetratricopeptide (TPR) repeat protein